MILALLTLMGCGCEKAVDTGEAADTGADSAADSDSAAETDGDTVDSGVDTSGDTDTAVLTGDGLITWNGAVDVDDTWTGTESVLFVGDNGLGDTYCEVVYAVTPVAARTDCADCILAFDVVFGPPEIQISTACDQAGYDAAAIAGIEGEQRGYGYALNYLGHSNVLMLDDEGVWKAVAFIGLNQGEKTLTYSWEQGYAAYSVP